MVKERSLDDTNPAIQKTGTWKISPRKLSAKQRITELEATFAVTGAQIRTRTHPCLQGNLTKEGRRIPKFYGGFKVHKGVTEAADGEKIVSSVERLWDDQSLQKLPAPSKEQLQHCLETKRWLD
ncbi:hypothetical protein H920_07037 [Fukomys damarensis]|uniref:Uncharacterized protein n=1 Tax=Fukomys damarensis TaxID=885580 RepID=A0A091DM12_FUKDA|nr:hypothetical protein H920_07037 [Fukomys damarensis]